MSIELTTTLPGTCVLVDLEGAVWVSPDRKNFQRDPTVRLEGGPLFALAPRDIAGHRHLRPQGTHWTLEPFPGQLSPWRPVATLPQHEWYRAVHAADSLGAERLTVVCQNHGHDVAKVGATAGGPAGHSAKVYLRDVRVWNDYRGRYPVAPLKPAGKGRKQDVARLWTMRINGRPILRVSTAKRDTMHTAIGGTRG